MHAAAQLQKQEAGFALAAIEAERRLIRSPLDGVVAARSVAVGEQIAASPPGPPLFVIESDPSELRLELEIDERYAGRVRPGLATFTVPAHGRYVFPATVRALDPSADMMTSPRRYRVTLDVRNADGALRSGMSATAGLPLGGVADALLVPRAAVRDGAVWLADEAGRPRQVPVDLGPVNDVSAEVMGPGLGAGRLLIADPEPTLCVLPAP
jgi:HlyD family secretion protein